MGDVSSCCKKKETNDGTKNQYHGVDVAENQGKNVDKTENQGKNNQENKIDVSENQVNISVTAPIKGSLKTIAFHSELRLIIIGDQGVGKTSITQKYCNNEFSDSINPTPGIDLNSKTIEQDGKTVNIQFWDSFNKNAQQIYLDVNKAFDYTSGIVFVYDVTNKESFENLQSWVDQLKGVDIKNPIYALVGNKCDLSSEKKVSDKDAKSFANKYNMKFLEVSAKNSKNIENLFYTLVHRTNLTN